MARAGCRLQAPGPRTEVGRIERVRKGRSSREPLCAEGLAQVFGIDSGVQREGLARAAEHVQRGGSVHRGDPPFVRVAHFLPLLFGQLGDLERGLGPPAVEVQFGQRLVALLRHGTTICPALRRAHPPRRLLEEASGLRVTAQVGEADPLVHFYLRHGRRLDQSKQHGGTPEQVHGRLVVALHGVRHALVDEQRRLEPTVRELLLALMAHPMGGPCAFGVAVGPLALREPEPRADGAVQIVLPEWHGARPHRDRGNLLL